MSSSHFAVEKMRSALHKLLEQHPLEEHGGEKAQAALLQDMATELLDDVAGRPKDYVLGALRVAAHNGDEPTLRRLLESHVNPNEADERHPKTGGRPLHEAARHGNLLAVSALLEYKADVHAKDDDGFTPLMNAASYGFTDVVQALLDAGADPMRRNEDGNTCLFYATEYGHPDVAQLLLDAAAKASAAK